MGHASIQVTVDIYGELLDYADDLADVTIDAPPQRCENAAVIEEAA